MALALPGIDHPDQIFQSTEQAHRALFGFGVVPWEFRGAARSWLVADLVALFMGPAAWLSDSPAFYLGAVGLGFAALSLVQVWAAYEIARPFGRTHALLAGFGAAVWFDLVYYATRPLSETVATSALLAAIALLTRPGRAPVVWGGLALGLAFVFRYHLSPALAVIALAGARRDIRGGWLPLLAGAMLPILLLGLVDWMSWGTPFISILKNLQFNLIEGRSQDYGVGHPLWYLAAIVVRWDVFIVVALLALGLGTAKKPLLLLVAAVILLSHSLIAHKEYRFILPALACLTVLVAIGMAELIRLASQRMPRAAPFLLAAGLILWLGGSLAAALSADGQKRLTAGRNGLDAFAALHERPALCGLAIDAEWWSTPGYAGLHRDVPLYLWETLKGNPAAVNYMTRAQETPPAPGFAREVCFAKGPWPAICLDRRDGACTPAPALGLNEELIRRGQ
jgi:hypothetical protein